MRERECSRSPRARFEKNSSPKVEDLQFSREFARRRGNGWKYRGNMHVTFVEWPAYVSLLASKVDPETEVCATCQENCIIDEAPLEERQLARATPLRQPETRFSLEEWGGREVVDARIVPPEAKFSIITRYRATRDEGQLLLGHARY